MRLVYSRERKAKRARTFDPASSSAADQHDAGLFQMALSNAKRAKHAKQGTSLLPASAHALVTACLIQQSGSLGFLFSSKDFVKQVDSAKEPFTISDPPIVQGILSEAVTSCSLFFLRLAQPHLPSKTSPTATSSYSPDHTSGR